MPRFAAVYRHFAADGALLYVGCSINPFMRLRAHEWGATWAFDIVRVEIEWFPCEALALSAEQEAIATERPRHNALPRKAKPDLVNLPAKPRRPAHRPREFDPPADQDAAIRAVWLDPVRSLADRCQAVADIYGRKVTRFTLYRRYGKPGKPRQTE